MLGFVKDQATLTKSSFLVVLEDSKEFPAKNNRFIKWSCPLLYRIKWLSNGWGDKEFEISWCIELLGLENLTYPWKCTELRPENCRQTVWSQDTCQKKNTRSHAWENNGKYNNFRYLFTRSKRCKRQIYTVDTYWKHPGLFQIFEESP